MQELLLEKIRTDGGVQSRERVNPEYVTELADLIKGGKKLPPIEVYGDGGSAVWCADGFHRILAHQQAGKRTIRCNVHKGTKADAIWASCAANQEHGLRRTNADKRHAVEMALKARPTMSNRALADHVGVDNVFVGTVRRQVLTVSTCERIGKDGKTYRVPPPPREERTEPPEREEDATMGGPPPPAPAPFASAQVARSEGGDRADPPGPPEEESSERLDEVGKPIPDHLLPLFDRGQEVQALLGHISSIKGTLKRAEAAGDALYAEINFNSALAAIETLHMEVKATKPYAVCPWCRGNLSDQCRGCGHRGVLGKYRWNTIVPKELKG